LDAYFPGTVTHYTYSPFSLPHMGGTDSVSVFNGKILMAATAVDRRLPQTPIHHDLARLS
jgi:hypothetical protein